MGDVPDAPVRLLVVEDDEDTVAALRFALADEGYDITVAPSLDEALALVDAQAFRLILTDLFGHRGRDALGSVAGLRERASPTPVGIMTGWDVSAEEATRAGFAFLIPKPFDLEDLVARLAACLGERLRPDATEPVRVVYRYFAALTAHDWDALARLCAEDVTYVLPGDLPYAGTVTGRAAFRAHAQEVFAQFPDARFEEVSVYALPHGLAARFKSSWRTPQDEGGRASIAGAAVFRFAGDLISRIGVRVNDARLRRLQQPQAPAGS